MPSERLLKKIYRYDAQLQIYSFVNLCCKYFVVTLIYSISSINSRPPNPTAMNEKPRAEGSSSPWPVHGTRCHEWVHDGHQREELQEFEYATYSNVNSCERTQRTPTWKVVESTRSTAMWRVKSEEFTTYSTLYTNFNSCGEYTTYGTPTWTADWLWFWLWLYATYTMTYHWQSSRHKRSGVDDMVLLPQVGKHWISNVQFLKKDFC